MGKTKDNESGGFLDLFELGSADFSEKQEEVVEPVTDGNGTTDVDELDESVVPESEAPEGEEAVEDKGAEKQTEESEESEEDASAESTDEPEEEPKKEEEAVEESSELETILNELVNDDTLLFSEDEEYESSPEGIKKLINETVEKKSTEVLDSYKENLPDNAKELLEILEKGGSVDDYVGIKQEVDFTKVPLEDKDGNDFLENQKYLIEDWMKIQKYTDEEIQDTLKDFEDNKIIKKQAEIARKKLASWQEEKNEKLIKEKETQKIQDQEKADKEAAEFKETVIATREIAGFKVSKDKAQKLFDFITKTDKEGKTAFQKTDTKENRLLYAYMAMEGFDKNKLTKDVATKQALKLKKGLSEFKDKQAAPKRGADNVKRTQGDGSISNINWII